MVDRIPQQDLEALNAYLDGELSAAERSVLESRLLQDPALQAELRALQATVGILGELERVRVPRSFTLDPAVYGRKPGLLERLGLTSTMPLVAGMAAAVVAVVCVGAVLLNGNRSGGLAASAPEVAMQDAAEESAQVAAEMAADVEEEEPAEEAAAEEEMVEMEMEAPAEEESAAESNPRPGSGGGGGEGGGEEGGSGSGGGPDSPGVGGDGVLPADEFYVITPDPNATTSDEGDAAAADGAAEEPPAAEAAAGDAAAADEAAAANEAQIVTDTPDDGETEQALPLTRSEEPDLDETQSPDRKTEPTVPTRTTVLAIAGIVLAVVLVIAVVALTRRRA